MDLVHNIFKDLYVQIGLLILFATFHGYAGAWLAVRMLFRPRNPIKLFGITIFPQGMIPRHRERLANAIGKAVGEELVSTETIHEQLIGKDFLGSRIRTVIDSYTRELLAKHHPSLIEALPGGLRTTVLDSIAALQTKLAEHLSAMLSSEATRTGISELVASRVDDLLAKRVSELLDDESIAKLTAFIDDKLRSAAVSPALERRVGEFIDRKLDELLDSPTPLGEMFTSDSVALLKEKALEQVDPTIRRLTDFAAAEKTRGEISSLIKHEVHDYYENLSFFKKIFVSRENLLDEVDELVNESFPRRIEETLRGTFFVEEARKFIADGIDDILARTLSEAIGKIAPEQLSRLKDQITHSIVRLLKSDETLDGLTQYLNETLENLRPHTVGAVIEFAHHDSGVKIKAILTRTLADALASPETANFINDLIAKQIEGLLAAPIGRLSDHVSDDQIGSAVDSLTDAVISAVSTKLPDAIREFDVGGVVREKIREYPVEKLESLVLSVAGEHLRTIELFGALFGFLIGLAQAFQFYIYAR